MGLVCLYGNTKAGVEGGTNYPSVTPATLPLSRQDGLKESIVSGSNIGTPVPGCWMFRIDGTIIVEPPGTR